MASKSSTQNITGDRSALKAAVERAGHVGLPAKLLDLARVDQEWRASLERALAKSKTFGKLLKGGAQPRDVWDDKSLLNRNLIRELGSNPEVLELFAMTYPDTKRLTEFDESVDGEDTEIEDTSDAAEGCNAALIIEEFGVYPGVILSSVLCRDEDEARIEILEAACAQLERELAEQDAAVAPESVAQVDVETSVAEIGSLKEQVSTLIEENKTIRSALQKSDKEAKAVAKDLKARRQEISRRDKKAAERAAEHATLLKQHTELEAKYKVACAELAEKTRQVGRLTTKSSQDSTGLRTIEDKRIKERQGLRETIEEMSSRLDSAAALGVALSAQVESLEADLAAERAQRKELEDAFSAFGMEEILGDSHSFSQSVDALVRFRDSVNAYGARQRDRENKRLAAELEAEAGRERAVQARKAQEQADQSWRERARERMLEHEADLFGKGPFDHVIIDGHNLVGRIFRPEEEARTRPWLEKMVHKMAARLEEREWECRFHLVFDTPHQSNQRGIGHGVEVYFQNNPKEGGADARIAQILTECDPQARYMVVSTDRKHVWADALERIESESQDIDLVQVELLAGYLQLLDHLDR